MPVGLKQFGGEVDNFLAEIGVKGEARVTRILMLLEMKGGQLRTESKALKDGLFELTPNYKGVEYRLLYTFHDGDAVVLNCFVKKTRKTPKHELSKARNRLKLLKSGEASVGGITIN